MTLSSTVSTADDSFGGARRWCGDPCADLLLLHRVSCEEPDAFWRQALEELGVRMAVPPRAVLQEGDPQDPDSVRYGKT